MDLKTMRLAIATVATLGSALAYGEVIYQNDFATRTSAAAIRSTEWKSVDYVSGDLLTNTNNVNPYSYPSGTSQKVQDGWIKSQEVANLGNAYVYADDGNDMAALGDASNGTSEKNRKICIVKQRLGATFTNGTVTVQFDFLPPAAWTSYDGVLRRAVFSVGDERFYSPDVNNDKVYRHTAGSVGVALTNFSASGSNSRYVYWNADVNSANTVPSSQEVTKGTWHRVVMTINLDAPQAWGFTMYKMGNHPAFDAETPATPVHSESNLPFADDTVTSVSSICLNGYGVAWGPNSYSNAGGAAPTQEAAFDNIRVSHNGVECYANDFTASRRRSLDGTTSWTYTPDCLLTNSVRNEVYVYDAQTTNITKLVPDRVGSNNTNAGKTVQPIGIDGWRRTSNTDSLGGIGNAHVYNTGNNYYLRFEPNLPSTQTNYGFFVQSIGSTVSSGKVRIAVDTRLPNAWSSTAGGSGKPSVLWLTLGDGEYYSLPAATAISHRFSVVGIRGANKNPPTYVSPSGSTNAPSSEYTSITKGNWYRLIVTADLDAGSTEYKIYDQGTAYPNSATPDGDLVYTSPTIGGLNGVTSIASFSLGVYYSPVYFDNIKIWHIPTGSESETPLYENFFSTRTIYSQDKRVAQIAGTLRKDPEGQDGWVHLATSSTPTFVTDDENPSLVFDRAANGTSSDFAAHDLGQTLRGGMVTAQVDIRPPRGWLQGSAAGSVYVRLGGDAHLMGNIRDNDANYLNNIACGFGFKNVGNGASGNLYTNSTIFAYRGDLNGGGEMVQSETEHTVDSSHWYRFVVKTEVRKNQYDLSVYDMGATQPTLATATPAVPVATFTALPFRRTARDLGGISCISVSTCNNPNSAYDDTLSARVDNLRVEHTPFGFRMVIK